METFSEMAIKRKVNKIYLELWRQTGQTQDQLPLEIVENHEENAYNDGDKIVIYTGLINNSQSWDEIALVLGHEIAHGNLWHLRMLNEWKVHTNYDISVLEGNADKLGALYAQKAGYNVCAGRELFKHWLYEKGDYLGGNHPSYAYRYNELNIRCE